MINKYTISQISITFLNMRILEKIFMGLMLMSVLIKYIFRYGATFDIFIFGGVLSILYFPLGFYYIGKPSINRGFIVSIILGFIYSLCIVTIILSALNIDSYKSILVIVSLILLITGSLLFYKLKTNEYSKEYIVSQFLRIAFIILINMILFIK